MTSPSATLFFGCFPHKDTRDILSENFGSHIFRAYSTIKEDSVSRYINKIKLRHGIGLPTTCGYHHCEKEGLDVRALFDKSYFALPVNHNTLHHFFAWKFYRLTLFPILEGETIRITNHDHDKYFGIASWENQVNLVVQKK